MGLGANSLGTLQELALSYTIPVFYSTNAWVKFYIAEHFRAGQHYVWCSEAFEGPRLYVKGMPPAPRSSCPVDIYRDLLGDVQSRDLHSAKIIQQRHSLNSLAQRWLDEGAIGKIQYEELVSLVNGSDFNNWRPLIYVIPQHLIHPSRVQVVRPEARAGLVTREYIISDLASSEFDVLEPARC
jgi:hypothetical protein